MSHISICILEVILHGSDQQNAFAIQNHETIKSSEIRSEDRRLFSITGLS